MKGTASLTALLILTAFAPSLVLHRKKTKPFDCKCKMGNEFIFSRHQLGHGSRRPERER